MHRSLLPAATAALALSLPVAAQAASLTYRDGSDVWVATVDGAQKRQVTTDGTAERPYRLPSSDDAGTVSAIRDAAIEVRPIAGAAATRALPWSDPIADGDPGPTSAEVNGSGTSRRRRVPSSTASWATRRTTSTPSRSAGTPSSASSRRAKRKAKVVAAGTVALDATGAGTGRLRFASSAKRSLKKAKRVSLTVTAGTLTTTVTLR